MAEPDNLIPLPTVRREPSPLEAEKFVAYLRRLEQEPWVVTDPHGKPVAVETQVGFSTFRVRLDLAGDYRGLVRVFVLLTEERRGRLAMFGRPDADDDAIYNALREGLRFLRREIGDTVMRATRAVAG